MEQGVIVLVSGMYYIFIMVMTKLLIGRRRRLAEKNVQDEVAADVHIKIAIIGSIVLGTAGLLYLAVAMKIWVWHDATSMAIRSLAMLPWVGLLAGGMAGLRRKPWAHWLMTACWLSLLIGLPLTLPGLYFLWVLVFRARTLNYFYPSAAVENPEAIPVK